ncbi:MAG: DMT family transporter [Puniceicoccales bacterium]|jgi:drug/metabolite transporter (DMT)-like permease|nr:DMT family transporter [Puniceicoccales bacterium]
MKTASIGKSPRIATGIIMIVGTVLCFACMDATAKWLGRSLPPVQVVAVRYIGSVLFASLLLNPWRAPQVVRAKRPLLQCLRSAFLLSSTVCSYVAVQYLPLTDMTTLTFASPLMVPLFAGPFLGEKIGPRRIAAVVVGFIGVLVVTRPVGHAFHPAALLVLLGAFFNALYSITTRKLAGQDAPETTMFYTGMVGAAVMLPVLPFVWATPPGAFVWGMMTVIGGLGAVAHWLLILAHKHAPASILAPFYYTQLLGAITIGAVVFGELPDRWTLIGAGIIVASGLYVLYRESIRRKEKASVA